ncbi:C-type lectin domain family 4 member F isoform X2 [Danio aesculapii]|uniref:C-type lectin domain family 4 member F isoform X2 n=1 Tax=Danio aesculapii TaxID=1142201 RepID=UPI0024C01F35|nr:C-type lectin domain family 4 member F isoform X2 [Danio aesculapii]
MMQYEKNGSSENIMKMDLESEEKMSFRKGHHRRKSSMLVLFATVCMIVFMVMTFVIFLHQQRKFSELESWMNSHASNITSISPHLQITDEKKMFNIETWMTNLTFSLNSITFKQEENLQKIEHQQDLTNAEVKSLSSAVSALTSKIDASVGNQKQKQVDIKNTVESLQLSVTSLQSDLQSKQSDFDFLSSSMSELKSSVSDLTSSVAALSSQLSKQDPSQTTEVKSLMNSLSSAVSALNNAVNDQKEKQAETERSLENLKSAVQSDQQNKQRDLDSLSSSMSELKSSVSDLTSSVAALSSQLSSAMEQQEVKSLIKSLSSAVSALTSKLSETDSLSSSLNELKSSVSDLSSSVAALSSKQQSSEERILNALKGLMSNTSAETADVPVKSCKSDWIAYKSSCFLFSETQISWSEARDYCKQHGALLLKIQDDNDEWSFLNNYTIPKHYWVGLTDQNTGQWRWVDETPYIINKARWNEGQPDDWKNHGLGEEGEDCGHISYTGKLNDIHCSTKMRFICRN